MKFNRIQTAFLLNQVEMFLHGTWFQILVFTGSKDISMGAENFENAVSETAKSKIEAAGGTVEVI